MKTRICWRCSSRGRLENYFRAKPLRDWTWLKYCERPPLAESRQRLSINRAWTGNGHRTAPMQFILEARLSPNP